MIGSWTIDMIVQSFLLLVAVVGITGLIVELALTALGLRTPMGNRPTSNTGIPMGTFIFTGLAWLAGTLLYQAVKTTLMFAELVNPFPMPSWPLAISLWMWLVALCFLSTRELRWVVSGAILILGGVAVLVTTSTAFALS